jgi:hypothetical protein
MNHTTIAQESDWNSIFPRGDHRWNMGVRRGDAATFFATRDADDAVCAERAGWLADDPETYAALPPEAEPALHETVQLARTLGTVVDTAAPPHEQLLALGRAWEPDFVWMHPDGHDTHHLIGGVVCFPSSWALREKLGRPMREVHVPVPGLNDALARQIESLFAKQVSGDVWVRENANYSRDSRRNHHPSQPLHKLDATITPAEFWIRLEHQLLLKLPRSGSILFGIRVEPYPLTRLLEDAQAAARLAEVFSTMSPAAAAYKGLTEARPQVIAWLRQAAGVVD